MPKRETYLKTLVQYSRCPAPVSGVAGRFPEVYQSRYTSTKVVFLGLDLQGIWEWRLSHILFIRKLKEKAILTRRRKVEKSCLKSSSVGVWKGHWAWP